MIATVADARRMARNLQPQVNHLLVLMTIAKIEREKMDALDRELIAARKPVSKYTGKPITEPKDTWTMPEEAWADYHAERQERIDAMGYKLPKDHCPALVAEHAVVKAERIVLDAAYRELGPETFPDPDRLYRLEHRRKALDLTIGLVVNAPGYRKPIA